MFRLPNNRILMRLKPLPGMLFHVYGKRIDDPG
jgi:hypothetical protein